MGACPAVARACATSVQTPANVGALTLVPPIGNVPPPSAKTSVAPVNGSASIETSGRFFATLEAKPGVDVWYVGIGNTPLAPPPLPVQACSKRRVPAEPASTVVPPTAMTLASDAG